jgi:hypothetical protein
MGLNKKTSLRKDVYLIIGICEPLHKLLLANVSWPSLPSIRAERVRGQNLTRDMSRD